MSMRQNAYSAFLSLGFLKMQVSDYTDTSNLSAVRISVVKFLLCKEHIYQTETVIEYNYLSNSDISILKT